MAVTWGDDTSGGTQLTTIIDTVEQFFDAIIASDTVETMVELLINNEAGTPTDGVLVSVYLSLDESSQDWDDEANWAREFFPVTVNEEKFTFFLKAVGGSWRLGIISTGPDDFTADMNFRERTA